MEQQKGVPDFWLHILKNMDIVALMIQEYDEAILKHLIDVRMKTSLEEPVVRVAFMSFFNS